MFLLNAFSLNMLDPQNDTWSINVQNISLDEARKITSKEKLVSAVGHKDTATVFSAELDIDVPENRMSVSLTKGETALVGQYLGPRLPEGTTSLPDGAIIKWFLVTIN